MSLSAKEVGRKLLAEVEVVDLSEVLQDLRAIATDDTTAFHFNVHALDKLLNAAHTTDPPLHARRRPPVLELISEAPARGVPHLLYQAIAAAVLPQSTSTSNGDCKGKGGIAIVLDADDTLSITRLAQVLQTADPLAGPHALQHVYVLRPQSLAACAASIASLPTTLQHAAADRPLALLILDSATAFYWPAAAAEAGADQGGMAAAYAPLVRALRELQTLHACPVLATSWGLAPVRRTGRTTFRHVLPGAWHDFVTARVGVARGEVRRFAAGAGLAGAELDREMRAEALRGAGYIAWVLKDSEEGGGGGRGRGMETAIGFQVCDDGAVKLHE